ncbi:MAG: Wzz/FepE/Etk N-terminal domain-containing protein [Chloroflexi bacterium]|nr:Wzz/FepE/Etk N-terminal domain-containing protein [Chloroflexota bacterium]
MQLQDYARVLWKRGWIILLLAVLTAGSAYVFSKLQTPIYSSTVTLSAVPARPSDYGQTLAIKNLLRNYVQQMQSPNITQQVIDKLQLDVTPDKFDSELNFNADESTLLITIEARHPNPAVAAMMAQTLAETFFSTHNQENLQIDQQDRILVNILRNASSPVIFSPKTSVNTLAGAILGGLIGVLIVFVLEWLESDVVRTLEDAERYIGVTVLGSIPSMGDKGPNGSHARAHAQPAHAKPAVCPHCGNPI